MNIFIRTDASVDISTGHVMRCLVLAEDLRQHQCHVIFICRETSGHMIKVIEQKGFEVWTLPQYKNAQTNLQKWIEKNWETDAKETIELLSKQVKVSWLIVDHYSLEIKWERMIKPYVNRLMVIDDLANRLHECALLLDQNVAKMGPCKYLNLVTEGTVVLSGPKYCLLRQEFREKRCTRARNGKVKRILISFGGSDPTNETFKVLQAIHVMDRPEIIVDVVIGDTNPNFSDIKDICEFIPEATIHFQVDYIAKLMFQADLAIGAGGSTTWERCFMGLPSLTIETADNQSEILSLLSERGVIEHLGKSEDVKPMDITARLQHLMNSPLKVKKMEKEARSIMKDFDESALVNLLLKGEE
ncbi:UDP-2,4-diacetamido-2,4,6-trideoxy-beta-L-altropyranose hydrolase [Halalkalibacillus halophilus]|uniref:UDP-2,4-diacetamido-2,4, 6-trideoxy-beta-L-altropyranose hydrolase n=1 Tax=Halalkalibacillus halophilus TaxID=392827 RepID=UPI0004250E0F|nr:UDP-2,4-diacetamido-2,4,6-trideoxy-beta-L-altropyranose hydrolase [Halalkalibacillus halophilus]